MEQTISLTTLTQMGLIIMALWGFYKVIMEIIDRITSRHDKEQEWDRTKKDLEEGRQEIIKRYDKKLEDLEEKIETSNAESEKKIQELKADMFILTKSVSATLDGLKQLGCNGPVTKAKEELDSFLMDKAYD